MAGTSRPTYASGARVYAPLPPLPKRAPGSIRKQERLLIAACAPQQAQSCFQPVRVGKWDPSGGKQGVAAARFDVVYVIVSSLAHLHRFGPTCPRAHHPSAL